MEDYGSWSIVDVTDLGDGVTILLVQHPETGETAWVMVPADVPRDSRGS